MSEGTVAFDRTSSGPRPIKTPLGDLKPPEPLRGLLTTIPMGRIGRTGRSRQGACSWLRRQLCARASNYSSLVAEVTLIREKLARTASKPFCNGRVEGLTGSSAVFLARGRHFIRPQETPYARQWQGSSRGARSRPSRRHPASPMAICRPNVASLPPAERPPLSADIDLRSLYLYSSVDRREAWSSEVRWPCKKVSSRTAA